MISISPGREVFRTGWESVCDRNTTSTLVQQKELEGWTLITRPDPSRGGSNGFEIWSTGDQMMDAGNKLRTVTAAAGNGAHWLELNNGGSEMHQTLGLERSIETIAGATYTLSLDVAGRPGYSADYTKLGILVDGVRIGGDASTSPAAALDWQTRSFQFVGNGGRQVIRIVSEAIRVDKNGRGMMLDDIVLSEALPAHTGREDSAIRLAAISAALRDTDGSETLTITLEDVPVGSVLSDGRKRFTATAGHTSVDLTGWALGQLSLIPPQDYHGRFTLRVVATATEQADATTARSEARLTVTVLPVNDPPTARDASYTLTQGGRIVLDFSTLIRDVDGDALTLSLTLSARGRLVKNAEGNYTYLPQPGFTGIDRIPYTVSDGTLSANAAITLRVVPAEEEDDHDGDGDGDHEGDGHGGRRAHPLGACAHEEHDAFDAPAPPALPWALGSDQPQRPIAIDWNGGPAGRGAVLAPDWLTDYFTKPRSTAKTLAEITGLVVKAGR